MFDWAPVIPPRAHDVERPITGRHIAFEIASQIIAAVSMMIAAVRRLSVTIRSFW
jgi:hypothetical protein